MLRSEGMMARPSLFTHRKFTKLCRMFGTTYTAVGVLEVIWHHAYQDGDPVIGTAEDVEFIVCWDGEPGKCASSLVECGFLEEGENGELSVHDLYDHAPDYVRKRQAREEERRSRSDNDGHRPVTDRSLTRTPAPAPAHIEECSNEHSLGEVDYPEDFSAFWEAYPRKAAKLDALKAWKTTKRKRPAVDVVVAKVEALAASEQWTKDGGQYVPYPASWLRAGGWDDEVPKRGVTSAPPKLVSVGAHTAEVNPWNVADVREYGGNPPKHPRWDDYIDDMACKPGQWPRFLDWLAQQEGQ